MRRPFPRFYLLFISASHFLFIKTVFRRTSFFLLLWVAGIFPTANGFAASVNDGFDPNANGAVFSIVLQPDRKIIIGGQFTTIGGTARNRIARLNADGSLDATFNPDANGSDVRCIALQPDGKIIIGGVFTAIGGTARNRIARLNTDGSLDATFNPDASGYVSSIALQPDGKTIIGGNFTTIGDVTRNHIARLNADGSLDTTFNPNASSSINSIALQPDGKTIIGGWFATIGGIARYYIARLNADGSLDATFNPSSNDYINTIALQSDGKIIIGGEFTTIGGTARNRIARLNADGSLDTTFNPNASQHVHSIALQPDGKIIIGGEFTTIGGTARNYIARLNANGSLDTIFNPNAGTISSIFSIALQPDGKIIIGGGFSTIGGTVRNCIARLNEDGSLDTTLNPNADDVVKSIALQPDEKIITGGWFTTIWGTFRHQIARLNADGSLDATFNPDANNDIKSIALQPDGKIIIGGDFTTIGGTVRNRIARLNADGSLDETFNPNANDLVYSIALQPDGKIIIGGYFTTIGGTVRNRIARLNADGSLDETFNPDANNLVSPIALQPDGKIIIGGVFTTIGGTARNRIARLNADGSRDTTFNPNVNGSNVSSIALQPDGKIIIGGSFSSVGGTPRNCIARLNADGSLDTTFNPNANYEVFSIALQPDGKIIIGGQFTTIGVTVRNRIARLNADGSLDATFNPDANNLVHSIALQPDGKIIIGGSFTTIGGIARNCIARLSNDQYALKSLSVSSDGTAVTWARSGSGPEIYNVTFEQSSDGSIWTSLGAAVRISGGWQLTGLSLPFYQNRWIRARGTTTGGFRNSSQGIVESVSSFYNNGILTVTKTGTGSGTVTSSPSGIACGSGCETHNQGTSVTLTATPDAPSGSVFSGWAGCDSMNGNQCTVIMNTARTVIATFTDVLAPSGTITINSGAGYTNALSVALAMTCNDVNGCSEMQFSNDNSVWSEPETFKASKAWTLLSGDESKNVYVRFKDVPGNWSSPYSAFATIILDTIAPNVSAGANQAKNAQFTQTATATDVNAMTYSWTKVDGPGTITFVTPTALSPIISANADGTYALRLTATDAAGNSSSSDMTLVWDTSPPTGVNAGGNQTTNVQIQLTGAAIDLISPMTYAWAQQSGPGTITIGAPGSLSTMVSANADGTYILRLTATDAAGNSSYSDMTLTVDTVLPSISIASPTGGTVNMLVQISGSVTDAVPSSGIKMIELQVTDGMNYLDGIGLWTQTPTYIMLPAGEISGTNWSHNTSGVIWTNDATYTITARVTDNAGNVTMSQPVTVTYSGINYYTELSVTPSSVSILQNGKLDVTGQLSRPGFPAEDLSNKEITLTIAYKPDQGNPVVKAIINANTNADTSGHYLMTGIEKDGQGNFIFSQKGIYTIQASFAGGASLMGATAECFVVVGQVAGYAILVEGRIAADPAGLASHNKTTNRIYNILKTQRGFIDDNIYYFNYTMPQSGVVVDELPTKAGIQGAIQTWAFARLKANPAPLYIIMVDHGTNGNFYIGSETITPGDLADWLKNMEQALKDLGTPQALAALAEKRIVIVGSCYSGSFITQAMSKPTTPGAPDRLIITSAASTEESYKGADEPDGIRSGEYFMEEFFIRLGRGYSFRNSFEEAARKTREYTRKGGTSANSLNPYFDDAVQHPLLEDSGDGKGSNTLSAVQGQGDGHVVKNLFLGVGPTYDTNSATNPAEIVSVTETRYLSTSQTTTTLELWANRPSTEIDWAGVEVRIPAKELIGAGGSGQLALNLRKFFMSPVDEATKRWETVPPVEDASKGIFTDSGKYEALYFVCDKETKKISPMKRSVVYKNRSGNTPPTAFSLVAPANDSTPKTVVVFKWYPSSDPDGVTYNLVIATDSGFNNVVYRREEIPVPVTYVDNTILVKDPTPENPANMRLGLKDNTDYYWKIEAVDGYGAVTVSTYNGNPQVWYFHTDNTNGYPGILTGIIYTDQNFAAITSAVVQATASSMPAVNTTSDQGQFALAASYQGEVTLTASAPGYYTQTINGVSVQPGETTKVYIPMTAKMLGDMNRDNVVSLDDAIIALKVVSGAALPPSVSINKEADVSGDNKIGLAEVIYIMQKVAGLRQP